MLPFLLLCPLRFGPPPAPLHTAGLLSWASSSTPLPDLPLQGGGGVGGCPYPSSLIPLPSPFLPSSHFLPIALPASFLVSLLPLSFPGTCCLPAPWSSVPPNQSLLLPVFYIRADLDCPSCERSKPPRHLHTHPIFSLLPPWLCLCVCLSVAFSLLSPFLFLFPSLHSPWVHLDL